VVLLSAGDAEYRALAIPRSYKTAPDAPSHLLVFRGGLCVRDVGLADTQNRDEHGTPNSAIVQEIGTTDRAVVGADGRAAVVVRTRYDSRVDVTPGQKSTVNDTVTGDTTLTLVDPAHPDGRWRLTLEHGRWAKDVLTLPSGKGVVVTTFLPRNGPTDMRILDDTGHESFRIPESSAETSRIDVSPDGTHVAAELAYHDRPLQAERGVMVIEPASGSRWTYEWRYGSDAEPLSWTLQKEGVLAVKLADGVQRFDAKGHKL
jgi:hypothetical protein